MSRQESVESSANSQTQTWSCGKIALVVAMLVYAVNIGALMSLQAPFYPMEATKKGATPSEYGFSFGITNLVAFIVSPLIARYGSKIGMLNLCTMGFCINAICCICFGLLAYAEHKTVFLGFSYLIRGVMGLSDVCSYNSAVGLMMGLFPGKDSTVFATSETLISLGYSLGPAIGSGLYTVGGFSLPFFVLGSCILVLTVVTLSLLKCQKNNESCSNPQSVGNDRSNNVVGPDREITFRNIFTSFTFVNPFVDNFVVNCAITFLESMLGPQMAAEPIKATQGQIGINFLVGAVAYMVASFTGGLICDKIKQPTLLSMLGNSLMLVGLIVIGPIPALTSFIQPTLIYLRGVYSMIMLGYASIAVTTFCRAHKALARQGFEMGEKGNLMVTGLWSATFYLGTFVGPTLAGVLVDNFGFKLTTMIYSTLFVGTLGLNLVEIIYHKISKRRQRESP